MAQLLKWRCQVPKVWGVSSHILALLALPGPELGAAPRLVTATSISSVSAVFADGVIMSTAILSVIVPPDGLSCLLPLYPTLPLLLQSTSWRRRQHTLKGKLMVSVIL